MTPKTAQRATMAMEPASMTTSEPAKFSSVNTEEVVRNESGVTAAVAPIFLSAESSSGMRAHILDEEALVRRAAAGDAEAFRQLFVRHRSDVSRLVYRMLNAPADL